MKRSLPIAIIDLSEDSPVDEYNVDQDFHLKVELHRRSQRIDLKNKLYSPHESSVSSPNLHIMRANWELMQRCTHDLVMPSKAEASFYGTMVFMRRSIYTYASRGETFCWFYQVPGSKVTEATREISINLFNDEIIPIVTRYGRFRLSFLPPDLMIPHAAWTPIQFNHSKFINGIIGLEWVLWEKILEYVNMPEWFAQQVMSKEDLSLFYYLMSGL